MQDSGVDQMRDRRILFAAGCSILLLGMAIGAVAGASIACAWLVPW